MKSSEKSDDPRLSALIQSGKSGQIVIMGSPYDFFRKRTINKGGEDNGPCCLRRFYPKVGPLFNSEYKTDISMLNVTDMGNFTQEINSEEAEERFKNVKTKRFKGQYVNYQIQSPEKVIDKMSETISEFIKNNQFPFIFGGSKQSVLASAKGFFKAIPQQMSPQILMISGRPFLKRPYDGNKGTSDNILTILRQQFSKRKITVFGPQLPYFPTEYIKIIEGKQQVDYDKLKNVNFVLLQQIRQSKSDNEIKLGQTTQALHHFKKVFAQMLTHSSHFHVSLTLQALCGFLGCRDISIQGFQVQEMVEIMYFLGQQKSVKSMDISEFNPSCQDYNSSLIIINLFYYFLMGRSKLANSQKI